MKLLKGRQGRHERQGRQERQGRRADRYLLRRRKLATLLAGSVLLGAVAGYALGARGRSDAASTRAARLAHHLLLRAVAHHDPRVRRGR